MTTKTEAKPDADEVREAVEAFRGVVNMSASALEKWLATDESRDVGQKSGGKGESTGHESGREIVALLKKKRSEYDADDVKQMKRVVSYCKRHLEQKPAHPEGSRWEASLKNWGHDPSK